MKPTQAQPENDSNSNYCEDCGCRITIGRCKHGITAPWLIVDQNSKFTRKGGSRDKPQAKPDDADLSNLAEHGTRTERKLVFLIQEVTAQRDELLGALKGTLAVLSQPVTLDRKRTSDERSRAYGILLNDVLTAKEYLNAAIQSTERNL